MKIAAKQIINLAAGIDEAGRGSIAGPVVAAAVILPKNHQLKLKDSKELSSQKREVLALLIEKIALDFKIAFIDSKQIDELNILNASLLAMKNALDSLRYLPSEILIDGNQMPNLSLYQKLNIPIKTIIKGDSFIDAIQAASIMAKVYRDQYMLELHHKYPKYCFDKHKGYPTSKHKKALDQWGGIKSIHRFSFAPVKALSAN